MSASGKRAFLSPAWSRVASVALALVGLAGLWLCWQLLLRTRDQNAATRATAGAVALMERVLFALAPLQAERSANAQAAAGLPWTIEEAELRRRSDAALAELARALAAAPLPPREKAEALAEFTGCRSLRPPRAPERLTATVGTLLRLNRAAILAASAGGMGKDMAVIHELLLLEECAARGAAELPWAMAGAGSTRENLAPMGRCFAVLGHALAEPARLLSDRAALRLGAVGRSDAWHRLARDWARLEPVATGDEDSALRSPGEVAEDGAVLVQELQLVCADELAALGTRLAETLRTGRRNERLALAGAAVLLVCGVAGLFVVVRLRRELRTSAALLANLERARDHLAQFRQAMDLQASVAVTDEEGVILEVNDRFCASIGFAREELIGRTHRIMKSTRHAPEFFREMWRTIAAGGVWRGEVCNLAKNGQECFFDTVIVPVPGPGGRPVRYIAVRHDVTERKRLMAEYERLALVAQKTTAAVVLTGPDGRIEWVNAAFERLTGHAADTLRGNTPGRVLQGPGTDPASVAFMREQVRAGRGFEVELLNYRRDRTPYWVQIKADPVLDAEGRILRFVAVETDITARRRAESLSEAILSSAAYALIATDAQGTIEVFNRGAERLLGYAAAEVVGQTTPVLFHDPDEVRHRAEELTRELGREVPAGFAGFVAKVDATGEPDERDWTYVRKDAARVSVRLAVTVMRDRAGRTIGYLGIAQDITERVRALERLRNSEERWQLAVAGSNDGAWEWDIVADRIWVSPRDREVLGLPEGEELVPRSHWLGPLIAEDAESMRVAVERYFAGQTPVFEHVHRVRWADGQVRWVLARGKAVFDAEGRPRRMLGTHSDVTASRLLEQLLRESEARLLEAQAVAHIGNWSVDAESRAATWSEEAARILGLSFHRGRLALVLRLCPASVRATVRAALGLALARGEGSQFDLALAGRSRPTVWVRVTLRTERRGERVVRVYGTVQDTTALHEAEARRREIAQRLEKIAAQVPGVLFQLLRRPDGSMCLPYSSPGVEELYDLNAEQLAADVAPVLAACHPDDRAGFLRSIEESAARLAPWTAEFRVCRADGALRWYFGNSLPERLPDGSVLWHGFITDVTARKQAEAQLREQEIFLQELFSGIELPIWVLEVAGGDGFRFAGVNPSFERITGLAAHRLIGRAPIELAPSLPRETARQMEDHYRDCVLAGTTINYEESVVFGGRERWWLTQLKPVRDSNGRIARLIGSAIEITERMEMEQRLRESEERFFLIARATSDAVWDYDPAAGTLWWSDGVTRLFGYDQPGPVAGLKWWYTRIHPEDRALVEAHFEATLASAAERWEYEYRFMHADGRCLCVFDRALILRGSGQRAIRVVGGMMDVTEQRAVRDEMRRAREAAEAANRRLHESVQHANALAREAAAATVAKSEFLANMSHEIRTPLNAVIGLSGLMLGTELSAQQREFAETIRLSGDTLLALINDILDFSKIESGSLELEAAPFELGDCVESALDVLGARAGEKGLDLVYWIEPGTPGRLVGDVTRLRQVLVNLVGNAVKFTASGEVFVVVEPVGEGTGARVRLRFTVRDTGIGIPAERMDRLFKSFSQVDASTTRKFGGTGLGLAICRRLVELMGGRIWAESEAGRGSSFFFEVEVTRGTASEATGTPPVALPADRPVLLVEDNVTLRRMLERHLGAWGLPVRAVARADEAIGWLVDSAPVALAIVDQQLGGADGLDLVRRLRALPGRADLPVLLYTTLGGLGHVPADVVVAGQLPKPVKVGALRDALSQVLVRGPRPGPVPGAPARRKLAEDHPLTILLAEDNVTNQRVAQLILGRFGYRADVANNGVEALEVLARRRYDLVFLDVQMPEMDGLTAARAICARYPVDERPHLVAMTANAMVGDRDECLAAGMQDYVAKPVQPGEVEAALRRAIEHRAKQERR